MGREKTGEKPCRLGKEEVNQDIKNLFALDMGVSLIAEVGIRLPAAPCLDRLVRGMGVGITKEGGDSSAKTADTDGRGMVRKNPLQHKV